MVMIVWICIFPNAYVEVGDNLQVLICSTVGSGDPAQVKQLTSPFTCKTLSCQPSADFVCKTDILILNSSSHFLFVSQTKDLPGMPDSGFNLGHRFTF